MDPSKHTSPISLFLTKESITRAPLPFTDTRLPHVISSHSTILFPQFQYADLHISRLSNVNSGSWKFYLKGKETLSDHLGNSRKSLLAIHNGSKCTIHNNALVWIAKKNLKTKQTTIISLQKRHKFYETGLVVADTKITQKQKCSWKFQRRKKQNIIS
jgi:hypothetical protein